jgi:uncharacterized membrane protein
MRQTNLFAAAAAALIVACVAGWAVSGTASVLTITAVLGAWTFAILKAQRQLENAPAIRRRLDRVQDTLSRAQ